VNVNSDVSDVTVIPSSSVDHAIGSFSYYNLSDPLREKLVNMLLFWIGLVRHWQSKNMNAPTIPEVRWEDVGGLQHIITELLDTIQLPLKFPDLIQNGLKRSGFFSKNPGKILAIENGLFLKNQVYCFTDLLEREKHY
jgi:SpoVK/Ycf46/Vps4 family AAA+-type ATPase